MYVRWGPLGGTRFYVVQGPLGGIRLYVVWGPLGETRFHVGRGPLCMWVMLVMYVGKTHMFMWYFRELVKFFAYGLWFKIFQVLLVSKGRARLDCTTSPDVFFHTFTFDILWCLKINFTLFGFGSIGCMTRCFKMKIFIDIFWTLHKRTLLFIVILSGLIWLWALISIR